METKQVKTPPTGSADPYKRQLVFELTYCEFMVLHALLANANCKPAPAFDMYEKLLHHIMVGIFKKFYSESSEIKNSYRIELTAIECIAFWLYWTDHSYSEATPTGKVLERMNTIILLMFTPDPYK